MIFWWSLPAHDWQSLNISSLTGKKIKSSVLNWRAGTAEHLAAQGEDNSLLVFWSTTPPSWQVVNVSEITGEFIGGVASAYQVSEEGETSELLSARGLDNSLLLFWYKPSMDWQSMNITEITGETITLNPEACDCSFGVSIVEHFAAEASNNRLLVFWEIQNREF